MTVRGRTTLAQPFWLGFDCYAKVTEPMLQEATASGLKCAGRYLANLDAAEVDLCWRYGFPLLVYLEAMVRTPLSAAAGTQYGRLAAGRAGDLGIAPGVHLCIDLEDPAPGSEPAGFVNAIAAQLASVGCKSALYLGVPPPGLTSSQVFALAPDRYIKGAGRLLEPDMLNVLEPPCGWAAIQLEPLEHMTLAGIPVDTFVTKLDYEGRALMLWGP